MPRIWFRQMPLTSDDESVWLMQRLIRMLLLSILTRAQLLVRWTSTTCLMDLCWVRNLVLDSIGVWWCLVVWFLWWCRCPVLTCAEFLTFATLLDVPFLDAWVCCGLWIPMIMLMFLLLAEAALLL